MSSNKNASRTVSISSSKTSVDYGTKMEQCNNFSNDKEVRDPINSSQLSYATEKKKGNPVSKTANSNISKEQQYINNEDPVFCRATNLNEHI